MTQALLVYSRPSTSWPSGVYFGSWVGASSVAQRRTEVAAFEAWRGKSVGSILDWIANQGATWTQIEGADYCTNIATYLTSAERAKLCLTVAPLPADNTTTLAAGATGAYDAHWTTLATNLVNAGLAAVPLRPFHEMNGNWYRWSLGVNISGGNPNYATNGGVADFIGYWQHIYTAMRAAGFTGKFIFSPNNGLSATNYLADSAWPGDSYVDVVGLSCYDQSYTAGAYPYVQGETQTQREARQDVAWDYSLNNTRGLVFWRDYAISHGKKFGLSEWGLYNRSDGHGGLDNPRFLRRLHLFLTAAVAANPGLVAFEHYFNVDVNNGADGGHYIGPAATSVFPQGQTVYRWRWGH